MPDSKSSAEERLEEFFGAGGARIVLMHTTEWEGSFGSASEVIRLIIRGEATYQLSRSKLESTKNRIHNTKAVNEP